jgi:hypothetical protein
MLPPGDTEPVPAPSAPAEEAPVEPDAPTAVADDDPMLPLPDDAWGELPGGEEEPAAEELADPAPEPVPEGAPTRHHHRRSEAALGADTPSPVEPAPGPDAADSSLGSTPAAGSASGVLMKSLPVVRSAERVPPATEMALPAAAPASNDPDPVPFDRRGPVAASVVLICAALAAHGITAWRRRPSRYWPA